LEFKARSRGSKSEVRTHPLEAFTKEVEAKPSKEMFPIYLDTEYSQAWFEITVTTSSRVGEGFGGRNGCSPTAMEATWWNWDAGSALFFWRWPKAFRKEARDGTASNTSLRIIVRVQEATKGEPGCY
jgi:hypothetical protein